MADILNIKELQAGYRGHVVVHDVSIRVEPGRITTMIGPNGAGKSTLLKTIAGQLAPIGGAVAIDGKDLQSLSAAEAARLRSVMMTERPSAEQMTCFEVVSVGRTPYTGRLGVLSEEDRRIIREAMALVRAEDLAARGIHEISDGQRQRILLARAIVQEPKLMLLDEPTSYLDIRHKLEFLDIVKGLARERGIGVFMSLHELEFAREISDEIVCVDGSGRVTQVGTPDAILRDGILSELYGIAPGRIAQLYGDFLGGMKGQS